jgi:hypothetical protein
MSRVHLKTQAEVTKLARLLDERPERLAYLQKLRPDDLRLLRELATDAHYASDQGRFQRIAFASSLLPHPLTALIAQKAFGPLLCARIAGVLNTDHAIALADRMPAGFLSDLAVELDPRRCSAIISGMPPEQIAGVAEILGTRGEYVAMGRFVGHMTDEAIEQSLAVLDEPALLRISYVLEGDDGLERVIGLMSRDHLRRAVRAASEHDLWPEALDLLGRVSQRLAGTLGDIAAEEDDSVLAGMVATAQADDLWDAVLPVMRAMSEPARRRFAELPAIHQPEVLSAIVRSAMLGEAWPSLLPLVPHLPREAQLQVWSEVLAIADTLPVENLRSMADEALRLGIDDMLPDVVSAAEEADLWERALRLLVSLGPGLHRRLAPLVPTLTPAQRVEAHSRARDLGVLGALGPLGDALTAGAAAPQIEETRGPGA